jgi:hypothetical protein
MATILSVVTDSEISEPKIYETLINKLEELIGL